jgi:hypothetical protein
MAETLEISVWTARFDLPISALSIQVRGRCEVPEASSIALDRILQVPSEEMAGRVHGQVGLFFSVLQGKCRESVL